jgi:uncharacterized protein (TIGR03437 family)
VRAKLFPHVKLLALALGCLNTPVSAQAPFGYRFFPTETDPANVLYDHQHDQFFVTMPDSNQLLTLSGVTGEIVRRTALSSPYGLSFSPDGSLLYVTCFGFFSRQGFYVVDTVSGKVVDFVSPTLPLIIATGPDYPSPYSVAKASNGKLFYAAGSKASTGSVLYSYNSSTNIATRMQLPGLVDGFIPDVWDLAAVLDGRKLIFSSRRHIWVYASDSDSIVADAPIDLSAPPLPLAVNSDASKILAGATQLFDGSLKPVGFVPGQPNGLSGFSFDGTRIFEGSFLTGGYPAIAVFDAGLTQPASYVPDARIYAHALAVNSQDMAVLLGTGGFEVLDLRQSIHASPPPLTVAVTPRVGSPNDPPQVSVNYYGETPGSPKIYFGSQPAVIQTLRQADPTLVVATVIPPAHAPGLVDVVILREDGWAALSPAAFSYGPLIAYQDINAGYDGTIAKLFGYGYGTDVINTPLITVGSHTVQSSIAPCPSVGTWSGSCLTFPLPPGENLGNADLTISEPAGSATKHNAFTYVSHRFVAGVVPYQMVLDEPRSTLYAADSATGNVLGVNTNTLEVRTILASPQAPITAIALTQDHHSLLAINPIAGSLTVLDIDSGAILHTFFPAPEELRNRLRPNNIVATARGTALISYGYTDLLNNGELFEVNLETGATLRPQVVFPIGALTLFSRDNAGTNVFMAQGPYGGSPGGDRLYIWNAATDAIVNQAQIPAAVLDFATSGAGDRTAVSDCTGAIDSQLRPIAGASTNSVTSLERSLLFGCKLHSSGGLTYVPTTKGIEVYATDSGEQKLSIGIPQIASTDDGLVIGDLGDTIFLAETKGIGIVSLNHVPTSIGRITQNRSAGLLIVEGSGFQEGAIVNIGDVSMLAQVQNSTRLTLMTPSLPAGVFDISVVNPDGEVATRIAAYDTRPARGAQPLLKGVTMPTKSQLIATGSGFTGATYLALNGVSIQTSYVSPTELHGSITMFSNPSSLDITAIDSTTGFVSNSVSLRPDSFTVPMLSAAPSQLSFTYRIGQEVPFSKSVSMSSPNGTSFHWDGFPDSLWISITPGSGDGNSSMSVSVDPKGLAPGLYSGHVNILSNTANPVTILVMLTVATPDDVLITGVNSSSGGPVIAPNTWIEIRGVNLAPPNVARTWTSTDFAGGRMPQQLEGVSVSINGKAGYVYYVSPSQVNILTPPVSISGPTSIVLTNNGAVSAPFTAPGEWASPSFFQLNGSPYLAAIHTGGGIVGPANFLPGTTTPARPGETITLFCNGLGLPILPIAPGSTSQSSALLALPSIEIGGTSATVQFAGLVAPGLYQVNIVVPSNTSPGDSLVKGSYYGLPLPEVSIAIQQ